LKSSDNYKNTVCCNEKDENIVVRSVGFFQDREISCVVALGIHEKLGILEIELFS